MIKAAICVGATLALFLVAACDNKYGIGEEKPFGEFTTHDTILCGKKLEKEKDKRHLKYLDGDEETCPAGGEEIENGLRYGYIDRARVGDLHRAFLWVDGNGKLVGIGGEFRSDERHMDYGVYKVGRYVADIWVTITGSVPEFSAAQVKQGMVGKEMLVATFDRGPIKGRWVKHIITAGLADKILDEVIICYK